MRCDFRIVGLLRHHFHTSIIADTLIYVKRKLQIITKIFTFFYSLRNLKKQNTIKYHALRDIKYKKVTKMIPSKTLTHQQICVIIPRR